MMASLGIEVHEGVLCGVVLDLQGNNIECVCYQPWWLVCIPYSIWDLCREVY